MKRGQGIECTLNGATGTLVNWPVDYVTRFPLDVKRAGAPGATEKDVMPVMVLWPPPMSERKPTGFSNN